MNRQATNSADLSPIYRALLHSQGSSAPGYFDEKTLIKKEIAMHAGFAETIITPPDANCLLAGYALYPAKGVHDELYAGALYLNDGVEQALLISYDLLAMEAAEALARQSVS